MDCLRTELRYHMRTLGKSRMWIYTLSPRNELSVLPISLSKPYTISSEPLHNLNAPILAD